MFSLASYIALELVALISDARQRRAISAAARVRIQIQEKITRLVK
jgi:hypothetical protein